MAKQLIKPSIDRLFRDRMTSLVLDLSKKSVFIAVTMGTKVRCPNCELDEASGAGSGVYNGTGPQSFEGRTCPVCDNIGFVTPQIHQRIKATVQWGKIDQNTTHPDDPTYAGLIPLGHARVKAEVKYYDIMASAAYYLVDGIRCSKVRQPIKRGLQSYVIAEMLVKRDD